MFGLERSFKSGREPVFGWRVIGVGEATAALVSVGQQNFLNEWAEAELPQQASSYGSLPVPVGGVTSNVLSPLTGMQSIRFDGTGYIDYGNAVTSVLTTNLWANSWTIESWVYINNNTNTHNIIARNTAGGFPYDLIFYVSATTLYPTFILNGITPFNTATTAISLNTWTHIAVTWDGTKSNIYVGGSLSNSVSLSTLVYTPTQGIQIGQNNGFYMQGNLADLRVSNVARYTGSSYVVPSTPFVNDSNTLLLLKSLSGQKGTVLEIQGRGLGAVSLGATRTTQTYPPAPMSSYLLDTTGNTAVAYGQGKYIASASSELNANAAWYAYDSNILTAWQSSASYSSAGVYTGSVTTVDTLGNLYSGEWLQLQNPVSLVLNNYSIYENATANVLTQWSVLGSRDGLNWTLTDSRKATNYWPSAGTNTFVVSATQAYPYYRFVVQATNGPTANVSSLTFTGIEESTCVTNDAKVGIGITNPQRALEVAGDLVVSGTISGGAGMGMFRNRIINGDMRIAQRGTSFTVSTTQIYTIDRMTNYLGTSPYTQTVTQQTLAASDTPYQLGFTNSIRITSTNAPPSTVGYVGLQHRIEAYNISDLQLGTPFASPFTISFWIRSQCTAGSIVSVAVRNGVNFANTFAVPFTINNPNTWQYQVVTIPPPPTITTAGGWNSSTPNLVGMYIDIGSYGTTQVSASTWTQSSSASANGTTAILSTPGNYIEITGFQLEKGTVATQFEFRSYTTELALCQRYYRRIDNGQNTNFVYIGTGFVASPTDFRTGIQHPVTMRAAATIGNNLANSPTSNAVIQTSSAGVFQTANAFAINLYYSSPHSSLLFFTTVNQTTGNPGTIFLNNTGNQYIDFNAEL